ncbi:MAG: hypothetical protein PHU75_01855 [Candidatus Nanopelagicales bacterium]|nr:hypothetical protein [Candidatus Nanopelagicales bacterium]
MTTTPEPMDLHGAPADRGAAMIAIILWGLVMMGLVLVVSQTVINQIRPSLDSQHAYSALEAAEAGLADIQARLQVGTIAALVADTDNAALRGWTAVPGGVSEGSFTYAVDATRSGSVGEIRAYVTGRSGDQARTIQAVLTKRSTLDYTYMSDIETSSPDLPGAYSTAANSGGTGRTGQELARLLCTRRWYEPGPVSVNSSGVISNGNQRNQKFCQWAGIYSFERLNGRFHTNDIWRLEGADLSATLAPGTITSACRTTNEGLAAGEVGCPTSRRYILTSVSGGASTWSGSTAYQGDAYRPASGTDLTNRNPGYDSVLDLPASPALLKQRASESGCIYTGPTRIRFSEESGEGYMYVTSPDTTQTGPGCDGSDGTTLRSAAGSQVTKRVPLSGFTDLVIYVQNVRRSTEVDDPDNAYDVSNQWVSGTEPTCTLKGTRKYPYVIPNDVTDRSLFNSGSTNKGFPSELADVASPWYGSSCANGDLYVQGSYKGQVMLSTENNIVLTGSLQDSNLQSPAAATTDPLYGKPNPASQSVMGLAAGKFAYAYRPLTAASTPAWVGDWKTSNASHVIYDFALLSIQECFGAQSHDKGPGNGSIHLWGSLAQKYRCPVGVGSSSGYQKKYSYDTRLATRTPPYMLKLSNEPWGNGRQSELYVQQQPAGASVTLALLDPDDTSVSVRSVQLASSPLGGTASMTTAGTSATVTSDRAGLVIVTYQVVHTDFVEVRRKVVEFA